MFISSESEYLNKYNKDYDYDLFAIRQMQISLANFTLLHNHLMSILTTNNYEHEHLPQKIMQYIGMIVESEKNIGLSDDFFDFFCENGGNKIIKLTLEVDPMLSVRVLAMLFINLTSHAWISYLLCQPFVVDAIQFEQTPNHEQWPQYYISLLKSLSIRFNEEQLSLFFNKKFCKFPLIYEALKYYNHPDCMVRTNVMNIILGIMKNQRLAKYFGTFPFTSYVINYCCQVMARIKALDQHLTQVGTKKDGFGDKSQKMRHYSIIKSYYIDIIDYICYLNDLIQLGSAQLSYFVMNSILVYIALPSIRHLLNPSPYLANSCLFLMITLWKSITNQNFKQTLTLLLLGRQLPVCILAKIKSENIEQQIYIPKAYTEQFNPNKYYWNKYDYQVNQHCMKLFEDINNFQTGHQSLEENLDRKAEFEREIGNISRSLGFDVLRYSQFQNKVPFMQLSALLKFEPSTTQNNISIKTAIKQQNLILQPNPIRTSIFTLLQKSIENFCDDSLCLCLCSLLNFLSKCETTDNKVLQFCGLLLPRLDTINYKEQFNIQSMSNMKNIWIKFISNINQNVRVGQDHVDIGQGRKGKRDQRLFGLDTIRGFMVLGFQCFYERLAENQEHMLMQFYVNSINELKQLIIKKNMKALVQNFQQQYAKWTKQSLFFNPSLNQSVLSPRRSVKQLGSESQDEPESESNKINRLYFIDNKQRVLYFIRKFSLAQSYYFKYYDQYLSKLENNPVKGLYTERYTTLYNEKYRKIEQMLKIGKNYQLGFKHMVECYSNEKKAKNTKKQIIVEDTHNFILVQPSNQQNSAKIIINHPWKYVSVEIDRETGRKMLIKLKQGFRGEMKTCIYFQDEARNVGTLDWMNGLKYERYQSEQAFILSYVKDCLPKC